MNEVIKNTSSEHDRSQTVILIVEDDPDSLKYMGDFIEKLGYQVVPLLSRRGAEVKEILEQQKIDLVISDGLNGDWEVVARHAREVSAKVLLISSGREYIEKAKEAGLQALPRSAWERMTVGGQSFSEWFEKILNEDAS